VLDSEGNVNNQDTFIGHINPFRYRGYYYDEETQLFYCNSRYYSPELCRWISPDSIEYLDPSSINGLNLYCYCLNNPIMYVDPTGHFAISTLLIGLAVTSLVSWGLSEIFGAQIVGGAGSIVNGATAISTGVSLFAFGPVGWIIGGIGIIAGLASIAFGTAEIQEGLGYGNWINDIGITGDLYTGLYIGSNIVASLATIGGNVYRNSRITSGVSQADKTGKAYSRYYQMDGKKVKSITHYGKGGTPKYRIDVSGRPHNGMLPHKHNFVINNGFVNKGSVDDVNYLLWRLLGNWR
jgi:RHS repeat-associated protein